MSVFTENLSVLSEIRLTERCGSLVVLASLDAGDNKYHCGTDLADQRSGGEVIHSDIRCNIGHMPRRITGKQKVDDVCDKNKNDQPNDPTVFAVNDQRQQRDTQNLDGKIGDPGDGKNPAPFRKTLQNIRCQQRAKTGSIGDHR